MVAQVDNVLGVVEAELEFVNPRGCNAVNELSDDIASLM
jgi:hypothetical protein